MFNICIFVLGVHVVVAFADELTDSDYDELVKSIAGQHILHSEHKTTSRSMPCVEVSDHNATVVEAVGRRNMKVVDVESASRFHLSFCSTNDASFCALNSICTTVYKWRGAKTLSTIFGGRHLFVEDEILLPSGCVCVLPGAASSPIIIL